MDVNKWKRMFFIGVGGIGMSALARYFNDRGVQVYGYDKTNTVLTKTLEDEGILIHYEDRIDLIPHDLDAVVYTPAIPKDHLELNHIQSMDIPIFKRAALLGLLSKNAKTIAVAGTHGKTTTSCIISHILTDSSLHPSSILGGIPAATKTNYIKGKDEYLITEADEFDRSFLHLHPYIGVITSVDPDHLDIYGGFTAMQDSFEAYARNIVEEGYLFIEQKAWTILSSRFDNDKALRCQVIKYGTDERNELRIIEEYIQDGLQIFTVEFHNIVHSFRMKMPGHHNVLNASVAVGIAQLLGLDVGYIQEELLAFQGIQRRYERILDQEDLHMIDDYAHHPTEITCAIEATRSLFPDAEITVVFQPHLFSRTQDFMQGFAESLAEADRLILIPIYPAREKPIKGVSSQVLLEAIVHEDKQLLQKSELIENFKNRRPEVLLILGAGDIGAEVFDIKQALKK